MALMVRLLPLLLAGCMTLSRVNGAKTLEPGQVEVGVGLGARTSDDPILPIPIPQGPVLVRIGLADDLDLGFRGYVFGSGVDVRYRFYHRGRLHLAVNPGIGAVVLPNLLNASEVGGAEASFPLLGEVEFGRRFSLSGGLHVTLRDRISLAPSALVGRFDVYGGAGVRAEARAGLFVFGLAFDGVGAPTRHTGRPSVMVGLDAKVRTRSAEERTRRATRRAER